MVNVLCSHGIAVSFLSRFFILLYQYCEWRSIQTAQDANSVSCLLIHYFKWPGENHEICPSYLTRLKTKLVKGFLYFFFLPPLCLFFFFGVFFVFLCRGCHCTMIISDCMQKSQYSCPGLAEVKFIACS